MEESHGRGGERGRQRDGGQDQCSRVSASALWVYLPVFSIAEHMFFHLTDNRRQSSPCFSQTAQHATRTGVPPERPKQSVPDALFWAEQSLMKGRQGIIDA